MDHPHDGTDGLNTLLVEPPTNSYGSTEQMAKGSPALRKAAENDATQEEQSSFIDLGSSASRVPSNILVANRTSTIVYVIFLLHGIGTLMPWNMFLTIAPEYFIGYKFKPLELNATVPEYSKYFFSYLGVCSQLPNLLLNFMNLFVVVQADLGRRIIASLNIVAVICAFTIVFIFVDTHSWMNLFFVLTMISVVILNSANGVYQNSIYGMLADFPPKFTNAVVIGNNTCGIFVSVILILTLAVFPGNVQMVATLYFCVALATILACLLSFLYLPRIPFYAYYTHQGRRNREQTTQVDTGFDWAAYKRVFKQTWKQMLCVFLTFFVTLALFPAIVSNVKLYRPRDTPWDFALPEYLYVPVITFLNFNVCATIGNVLANFVQWPDMDDLIWPVALRVLFIPFFLFCNYGGLNRAYPVYITSEYVFIFMLSLMSLTHGYFSSLGMMYAPRATDESNARVAGMMSAFFLVLGIAVGVSFTFLESYLFLSA
ncbi:hypothetical protein M3Y99_00401100 [Aphelenchoides fujianensis]|nr:hypothetical protein M3Y99_00401100 [Aphelenchoides fujianensis]